MSINNVIVFGDSITYGMSDFDKGGWVSRLRFDLELNSKTEVRVYDMGIPGQDSCEVLKRFKTECGNRFVKEDNNVIIFAIGINDTQTISGTDRVPLQQFKENIEELYKQAAFFTKQIVFVGLTCVDESLVSPLPHNKEKFFNNEKIKMFDFELESFCKKKDIFYIHMFDLLKNEELFDGLHPDAGGHHKMFERIKTIPYIVR